MDPLWIPIIAIVGGLSIAAMQMHHDARRREFKARIMELEARGGLTGQDAEHFAATVDRLEKRLKTLEAILDDEAPGWRRKYE